MARGNNSGLTMAQMLRNMYGASVIDPYQEEELSPFGGLGASVFTPQTNARGPRRIGQGNFEAGGFEDIYEDIVDIGGSLPGNPSTSIQDATTVQATRPPLFPGMPNYVPAGTGATPFMPTPPRQSGDPNAPYSFVTAAPETYIDAEGDLQTVGNRADLLGSSGDKLKIMESMPRVSGRDFKSPGIIQDEQDKIKSAEEQKAKDRIWGNYAYDPEDAQKRYEDSMQDILRKSMMLNLLAQLTGGKSMAAPFVEMSTKRLEIEEKFKDQGRLQDIQRGIYYTQDGLYDPPKNQQEAFDRAMKFGASPALAEKISGYAPAEDTRAYNNWHRVINGTVEQTTSRTGVRPEGKGWVKGAYSAPSGSGGTETERALNRVDALVNEGNVPGAIQELEKIFTYKAAGDITSKQETRLRDAVDIVWKSINPSLKITVPAEIDSISKLDEWEKTVQASGRRGYYKVGNSIGIIE